MSHGRHGSPPGDEQNPKQAGGHGKHGVLKMIACCVPMVLVFVLIGLKVI